MTDEARTNTGLPKALLIQASVPEIIEEMEKCAAMIAYWGEQYGAAKADLINAEHEFTHWKAMMMRAALDENPKLSDAKAQSTYRADDAYTGHGSRIAAATQNVTVAMGYYNAFKSKKDLLETLLRVFTKDQPPATVEDDDTPVRTPMKKPGEE